LARTHFFLFSRHICRLPLQTSFVHSDFMESEVEGASLDTITCLSVTKWVHLNRGDQGLQALFAAFRRALVPGGLLVLEPQPWSSYRAAACKIRRDQAPPGSFFHRWVGDAGSREGASSTPRQSPSCWLRHSTARA
jgi:ubiquinone/menaquinone biosynthesis C-methylase UbiE